MLIEKIWRGIAGKSDEIIKEYVLNGGFTGVVLENGYMGLAMNVRSGTDANQAARELLKSCIGMTCKDACERLFAERSNVAENTPERFLINSTILATCNAVSRKHMSEEGLAALGYKAKVGPEGGPVSTLKEGEVATVVGYGGMVRPMSKVAKKVFVTELEPELFSSYHITANGIAKGPTCSSVVPSARQEEYFSQSDRIFLTGCTLVTDTMDEIIEQCKGKHIVVYGGTASFIPDILFECGIESIHTMIINNVELMTDILVNCAGAAERFFPMASDFILLEKA